MLQTSGLPVDQLFRAFSDRTRLRILHLLADGELSYRDLVEVLKVPQPTASRHLAYLRRSGLVEVRQDASWKYYSLADRGIRFTPSCWSVCGPASTICPNYGETRRVSAGFGNETPVGEVADTSRRSPCG